MSRRITLLATRSTSPSRPSAVATSATLYRSEATMSMRSPGFSTPTRSWFGSPGTCTARMFPASWPRMPCCSSGLKRRVVICSPW
jgi:hypothetical protein